jgi:segregation and condensation protein A
MEEDRHDEGGLEEPESISLEGFRAELEVFDGPLDLLLHLVKQQEVDIMEVSLAQVTDRYLAAVRTLQVFDVNQAAEFLTVAAQLMEIKSRLLLPSSPIDEDEDEDDPGMQLIRRLLEYKEFREAADHLEEKAEERSNRFARPRTKVDLDEEDEPDPAELLEDVAVWDLMMAFSRVMEQTSMEPRSHIIRSEVPLSVYIDEVVGHMRRRSGSVAFMDFFMEECTRPRIVGIFLALLELVRRRSVQIHSSTGDPRDMRVSLCAPPLSPEAPDQE